MNRIDATFQRCAREKRKALVMFVSAGDPCLEATEEAVINITAGGADLVEIGVPFSDPMADGPTIQEAGQRALAAGTTLQGILAMVRRLRERGVEVPFVLFSYYNVLLQYGLERLARDARDAGIDGCLVVDVPMEEKPEVAPLLHEQGLQWISLIAPTTSPERAARIVADAEGFVYCITVKGVTGARAELPENLAEHLEELRAASPVPVVAGFGVSTPEMAALVARHADGVVVGSALVRTIHAADDWQQGVEDAGRFVAELRAGLDR